MKRLIFPVSLFVIAFAFFLPARAQELSYGEESYGRDSDFISLGIGMYDIGEGDEATDFRGEYRWGKKVFWQFKPWAGLEVTSDTSVWGGGGVLIDFKMADNLILIPSFGAGFYSQGDSNLDLDFPLEFRSQIEAAYEFANRNRVSVAFGHISNASLGDKNPGVEILNIYWHLPVNEVFR